MGAIAIAGTWRIVASPEALWDVVSDLGTWPRWWPAIREVAASDGDTAHLTFDTPPPLRPLVVGLTVVDRIAPRRLAATTTDGPLAGDATLTVTASDGHTAVAFDLDLRARSLLFRPVERMLAGAARSGGHERLRQAGDDLATLVGGHPLDHDV